MYDIFVSFDYENDRRYKYILEAWNAHTLFHFTFQDFSSTGINTFNAAVVKANLTRKISLAAYTLCIVGKYANQPHADRALIGNLNWINWKIAKSKELSKKLIGVKIDRVYESPNELLDSYTSWAMSFTQESILNALRGY